MPDPARSPWRGKAALRAAASTAGRALTQQAPLHVAGRLLAAAERSSPEPHHRATCLLWGQPHRCFVSYSTSDLLCSFSMGDIKEICLCACEEFISLFPLLQGRLRREFSDPKALGPPLEHPPPAPSLHAGPPVPTSPPGSSTPAMGRFTSSGVRGAVPAVWVRPQPLAVFLGWAAPLPRAFEAPPCRAPSLVGRKVPERDSQTRTVGTGRAQSCVAPTAESRGPRCTGASGAGHQRRAALETSVAKAGALVLASEPEPHPSLGQLSCACGFWLPWVGLGFV